MPKITGGESTRKRLLRMSGNEKVALVGQALFVAGQGIEADAKHSITLGAVSGKGHTPAPPGQPPNEDTGHLRSNIKTEQPAPLRVLVTSNARYAAALEFGTSKMQARPYMGPAARANRKRAKALVNKVIDKVVKG